MSTIGTNTVDDKRSKMDAIMSGGPLSTDKVSIGFNGAMLEFDNEEQARAYIAEHNRAYERDVLGLSVPAAEAFAEVAPEAPVVEVAPVVPEVPPAAPAAPEEPEAPAASEAPEAPAEPEVPVAPVADEPEAPLVPLEKEEETPLEDDEEGLGEDEHLGEEE